MQKKLSIPCVVLNVDASGACWNVVRKYVAEESATIQKKNPDSSSTWAVLANEATPPSLPFHVSSVFCLIGQILTTIWCVCSRAMSRIIRFVVHDYCDRNSFRLVHVIDFFSESNHSVKLLIFALVDDSYLCCEVKWWLELADSEWLKFNSLVLQLDRSMDNFGRHLEENNPVRSVNICWT